MSSIWVICEAASLQNIKRPPSMGLWLGAVVLIWAMVDPMVSEADLARGDMYPTMLALGVSLVAMLFAVINEVSKEVSVRFHLLILSKPILRYEYLLGKILGAYLYSLISMIVFCLTAYIAMTLQVSYEVPIWANLLRPIIHFSMYLWIFSLVATVVALFVSEAFFLIIITLGLGGSYVIGLIPSLQGQAEFNSLAFLVLKGVYFIFPNFQYFASANFETYNWMIPILTFIYAAGYTGLILPLAIRSFNKKSFL
ncbi:MAG: hypothetical protein HQL32_03565 [Planctomycetes bacterium]|nr:hypothetical protein [Planctomycetota bacterium]